MQQTSTHNEVIETLDFGINPPDLLVVRENSWPRIVGAVLAFMVAPAFAFPISVFQEEDAVWSIVLFVVMGAAVFSMGLWLLWQFMHSGSFYIALDDRNFYRRSGRSLVCIPLADIDRFESRSGTLRVRRKSTHRPQTVLKALYVSERLRILVDRLNTWLTSPGDRTGLLWGNVQPSGVEWKRREVAGLASGAAATAAIAVAIVCIAWFLPDGAARIGWFRTAAGLAFGIAIEFVMGMAVYRSMKREEHGSNRRSE